MKQHLITLIFFFSLLSNPQGTYGQGCSDAGACTINTFRPTGQHQMEEAKHYVRVGLSAGQADNDISVLGSLLEYGFRANSQISFDAKLTTLGQSGNDISVYGLSDVFINGHFKAGENFKFSLGAKLPLTDGNRVRNGLPLPMDYQSSLGTFDLIAGIGLAIQKLQLAAAIQQPLTQNKNNFSSELYPPNSPLRNFQSTRAYQRSADALLRLTYPFKFNEKWQLSPSALGIYHLKPDSYQLAGITRAEIAGSDGITLNANVYLEYKPSSKHAIQLVLGAPLLVRDARPDGLTRSFVGALEYKIEF